MGAWINKERQIDLSTKNESHPLWVRGLKPVLSYPKPFVSGVAPFMGAWIETLFSSAMSAWAACRTHGCVVETMAPLLPDWGRK